jgi:hypothetical protein
MKETEEIQDSLIHIIMILIDKLLPHKVYAEWEINYNFIDIKHLNNKCKYNNL